MQDDSSGAPGLAARLMRDARDAVGGARALAQALQRAGLGGSSGAPYTSSTVESWVSGRSAPPATVFVAALRLGQVHLDRHLYAQETRPDADEARLQRVEEKADALLQMLEDGMQELRTAALFARRERTQLQEQLAGLAALAARLEAATATAPPRPRSSEPLVLG